MSTRDLGVNRLLMPYQSVDGTQLTSIRPGYSAEDECQIVPSLVTNQLIFSHQYFLVPNIKKKKNRECEDLAVSWGTGTSTENKLI